MSSRIFEGWFDADSEWVEPRELSPVDEIVARLRGYHDGGLHGFLAPAARWEQGLKPTVLSAKDEALARELLALPADMAAVERVLTRVDERRVRVLLRRIVVPWREPIQVQQELRPYLQRRHGEVLWVLDTVGVGVTGVRVAVSISAPLPSQIPYHIFWPRPAPYLEEPERLLDWWGGDTGGPLLRVSDDVGTLYAPEVSRGGYDTFPVRTLVDGQWQARTTEGYSFTFVPGVPETAGSVSLTGRIDLTIEQPLTETPPWSARDFALGEFSYTIDLRGWWPGVIRGREDFV